VTVTGDDAHATAGGGPAGSDLAPLEAYRTAILARLQPLEPLELALLEAHGCVLAEDVLAPDSIPRFDNSAMDGYAVVAGSVEAGAPLELVGESAAGSPTDAEVTPGSVVRIMTGAPVPAGADAIVPVEQAEERDGTVLLRATPRPGDHVRRSGEDVRAGDVVLSSGALLDGAALGMLASVGRDRARVHPRPRVGIVATGDEVVEPGEALGPGQLYDSNSYMLTALAREAGARSFRQPIVPDDKAQLEEAFEGALAHADVLVTSGGVSAGRYDLVKEVLAGLGDVAFTKVAMKPGMPQAFGFARRDSDTPVPCFGLPGNPVSAFVSWEVFVRPALRRLQGRSDLNRPRVTAVLDEAVDTPPGKVTFVRVVLRHTADAWRAVTTGAQGSGLLHSVVAAHGLAEIPAERTVVEPGERVLVHLLVEAA
jgi:molybdopterin molybdotransferase